MKRINLRPVEPEDLELLYALENDMQLWTVGQTNVPYSRYLLREYVASNTCDIYADRQMRLMVEDLEGNVVGIVDITNFEPQHNRAELGLVVLEQYRHHGYGKEIIDCILDYSRRIIHLHQLYAVIAADNTASLNLFSSLGFQVTHELTDWLYDGEKYGSAVFLQLFL